VKAVKAAIAATRSGVVVKEARDTALVLRSNCV
jgi:hypothetical protein